MNNLKAKFILKNFIKVLLLLFAVSVAAFALMTASPIDPLKANVGQAALGSMSQEQIVKLEEYWGVGQPPLQRYIAWFRDFVRGDMGISLLYRQKVTTVIAVKLGNSLFLMIIAWVLSGLIGFLLGSLAGMNRGKPIDDYQRILSGDLQHSGILDCHVVADHLWSMAQNTSHRIKRTDWSRGKRSDFF